MFYKSDEGGSTLMIRFEDVAAIYKDSMGFHSVVLKSGFKLIVTEEQAEELAQFWA